MILIAICLISLLVALPGLISKAGYSFFKGLIPGYNIYLFFSIIEFPPILLMLMALGLIFLPDRVFVITLLCILLPFIMYPFWGYIGGVYSYDVIEEKYRFFKKNKILCVLLVVASFFLYNNFTMLVEENRLIDKSSVHYVNELYMSDGRIYENYLNEQQQKMYMYIFENAKNFNSNLNFRLDEFDCDDYGECGSLVSAAHEAILVDHPEMINYAGYSWSSDGETFKLNLKFAVNSRIVAGIGELRIKRIINKIKNAAEDMTDLEKIQYVYNWIGENNSYDTMFTTFSKNQSIYNVFMNKNAVCAGFAKASAVIFQNIGIESYTITGYSTGEHMWNVVKLDGEYYYYDSTVATSISKDSSYYYDGLKQEYMLSFIADFPEWYPDIATSNGLYIGMMD